MGRTAEAESTIPIQEYYNENYFSFPAMASMCEQIIHVNTLKPKSILEIGKGNGFVSDFLSKAGYQVTTFDINPNLEPDVVGSLLELDHYFDVGSYDLVLCAEVLEHIPFECFVPSLNQIARVSAGGHAIITLPRAQDIWLDITCRFQAKRMPVLFPNLFIAPSKTTISACHHWEIDHCKKTKLTKIKQLMTDSNFQILKVNRSRHCAYHRFFELKSNYRVANSDGGVQ